MKFRSWFILTLVISIFLAIVSTYRPYLTMEVVDNDITKLKDKALMLKHIYLSGRSGFHRNHFKLFSGLFLQFYFTECNQRHQREAV
jgi:hypothetical protein